LVAWLAYSRVERKETTTVERKVVLKAWKRVALMELMKAVNWEIPMV
jgi:hypothetical protein